jgi:hypothetical protein
LCSYSTNDNIPFWGKSDFTILVGRFKSCVGHRIFFAAMFGLMVDSIHASMDVFDDSKRMIKEIYQVSVFMDVVYDDNKKMIKKIYQVSENGLH